MTERTAYAEASAWLAQLHGPERCAELESDFNAWLAAAPEHGKAFERVTEVWDSIGGVNVGGLPRLAHDTFKEKPPRINLTLVALAIGVLAWGAHWLTRAPVYFTEIGEQRTVTLEDGSRVSLDSTTRIEVNYKGRRRLIELVKGEALFEVAQIANRPFIVTAGDRRVTALGTSFLVRRDSDRVAVTLLQGKVSVEPTSAADPPAGSGKRPDAVVTLNPGQRLVARANRAPQVDTPPLGTSTAWKRGEVILDETPLSEAVAEMNRYDRARLVVGADLAALPISGIYRTGNNRDFAHAVATLYQLEVVPEDGGAVLKMTSRR